MRPDTLPVSLPLFLSSPEITTRIRDFLAGEQSESGSLAVPFDYAMPTPEGEEP